MTKEELEKENAELIQENEEMKNGLGCETCQIHLEYMSLNNRIADLEKENAELKEKLKPENCLKLLAKEGYIKFTSDNLTKAREKIRNLLEIIERPYQFNAPEKIQMVKEAEQFLKDSEVEK